MSDIRTQRVTDQGVTKSRPRSLKRAARLLVLLLLGLGCESGPTQATPEVRIDFDFPGANLAYAEPIGLDAYRIGLRPDTNASTNGWFSFRVQRAAGHNLTFRLENQIIPFTAWLFTHPVVSSDDGRSWTRITDTEHDSTTFIFSYTAQSDDDWVAVSPAYSFARYLALVDELERDPEVAAVTEVGRTIGGEPLHHMEIRSQPTGTLPAIWAVARQHPGEAGGSYMMEGFLRWAISSDPDAVALRAVAEIHAIPFLNPDGVLAGNQRVNLAGLDLNRQWANPTLDESPAVYWARDAITAFRDAGGDTRILLDFHSAFGHRNFFYYNQEAASSTPLYTEVRTLMDGIQSINGDFVPLDNNIARVLQGERARGWAFAALETHGLTIESSANDVDYGPFVGQHMTPERLLALGEAVGRGILRTLF